MVWKLFYMVLAIAVLLLSYGIFTLAVAKHDLVDFPPDYAFGPGNAALSVIEFSDFNCPHCRDAFPVLMEAAKQDGNVRIVPLAVTKKDNPSYYATRLTYAAELQGKYREAYQEFITDFRKVDESDLDTFATKLGLDAKKLREDVDSPGVTRMMDKSAKTYLRLGGQYTPTFFIGPTLKYVPEAPPTVENFLALFSEARGEVRPAAPAAMPVDAPAKAIQP